MRAGSGAADGIDSRTVSASIEETPSGISSDRASTYYSCCACSPFRTVLSFLAFESSICNDERKEKMKGTCQTAQKARKNINLKMLFNLCRTDGRMERLEAAEKMPDFDFKSKIVCICTTEKRYASISGMKSISRKSTVKWFREWKHEVSSASPEHNKQSDRKLIRLDSFVKHTAWVLRQQTRSSDYSAGFRNAEHETPPSQNGMECTLISLNSSMIIKFTWFKFIHAFSQTLQGWLNDVFIKSSIACKRRLH